ncbi:MAG: 50S ribosomal protein L11 methyltransferase [Cyanobacteria bacterium HKST-UBA06]|nr:50S ribosomal protein L11 methyltransferase [Cyanobacteria bacterium HKST-UBA06]
MVLNDTETETEQVSHAAETAPDFENPETRLRINPETYLKFEDGEMVTMQHLLANASVRIKYDIMLILYPMVNWVTVAELCEGWPPEDQAKIKEHLAMMYKAKLVVTDESEIATASQSGLPKRLGDNITINIENHVHMLQDTVRMASYQRAIQNQVNDGDVVLDLGAGTGILSFFAARAGASRVYAIEKRPDIVNLSTQLAIDNNLQDVVVNIESSSQSLDATDLDPRPTVMVSEIIGNAVLDEHIIEFTLDARDRLLAPGATLIPFALDLLAVPFYSGQVINMTQDVAELEAMYGFNFDLIKTVLDQKPRMQLREFNPDNALLMGKPIEVINLDFRTLTESHFETHFEVDPLEDGFIDSYCLYFRVHLDEQTILTNSPWAPKTHWTQVIYAFPNRRAVKVGEPLTVTLKYDGSFHMWYPDEWETAAPANEQTDHDHQDD